MTTLDEILEHHGIKGMKWGVRRADPSSSGSSLHKTSIKNITDHAKGGSSEDAAKAAASQAKAKTSGTHSLSNTELQHLITRMNLERQYSQLTSTSQTNRGKKFAKDLLVNVAKQQVTALASKQAAKAVAKVLGG